MLYNFKKVVKKMKALVIGKKHSSVNDNGVQKDFYKLFITHKNPFDNEYTRYEGIGCSDLSVPKEVFDVAEIDKHCLLDFDANRKLLEFEMLDD